MRALAVIGHANGSARLVELATQGMRQEVCFDNTPMLLRRAEEQLLAGERVAETAQVTDEEPKVLQQAFELGRSYQRQRIASDDLEGPGRWLAIAPGDKNREPRIHVFDLPADWSQEAIDYAFGLPEFKGHEPTVVVRLDQPAESIYALLMNLGRDLAIDALKKR